MREAISRLVDLGSFPPEASASDEDVAKREALLMQIEPPVTDDEALALIEVTGPSEDSLFGLKWTLLKLVESAPGWPLVVMREATGPWHQLAQERAERWRGDHKTTAHN